MKTKLILLALLVCGQCFAATLDGLSISNSPGSVDYMRIAVPNGHGGFIDRLVPATAAMAAPLPPSTNAVMVFDQYIAQGMCCNGPTNYYADTASIFQADFGWKYNALASINSAGITAGLTGYGGIHIGDPTFSGGYLYLPIEAASNPCSTPGNTNVAVEILSPSLVVQSVISVSNKLAEISAVCVDPNFSNNPTLFAVTYCSVPDKNAEIFQYTITGGGTNLSFVRAIPLSMSLPLVQGLECTNGLIYAYGDGDSSGENLWTVNETNGQASLLLKLPWVGEAEGLCFRDGLLYLSAGSLAEVFAINVLGAPFSAAGHTAIGGQLNADISHTSGHIGQYQLPVPIVASGNSSYIDLQGIHWLQAVKVYADLSGASNAVAPTFATTPTTSLLANGKSILWNSNSLSSTNSFYITVNSNSVIKTYHMMFQP